MRVCFNVVKFCTVLAVFIFLGCKAQTHDDDFDFDSEDLIDSLKEAMGTLFEYTGDENGCFFKCPNGVKPVKRRGHRPRANGCGAFGIKLDTSYLPAIEECCNKHDLCYDTCNKMKVECDDQFRDCLTDLCKVLSPHVSSEIYKGCKSTADMMYAATMTLGCKPYKDSQKDACDCSARIEL